MCIACDLDYQLDNFFYIYCTGFVNTAVCRLQNTALVPMTFNLRVPGDGVGDSICSTSEYGSTMSEAGSNMPPKVQIYMKFSRGGNFC